MSNKHFLDRLLLEAGGLGQYEGARRQVDIKLGPGKNTAKIVELATNEIHRVYSKLQNNKIDERYTHDLFRDIFGATRSGGFVSIIMWPLSKDAVISVRSPTDVRGAFGNYRATQKGIAITRDAATIALTNAFLKVLHESLDTYGLESWVEKTQRVRHTVSKEDPIVKLSKSIASGEEEIKYEKETDELVMLGDLYKTGNVKIEFLEPIKATLLRDILAQQEGYETHGGSGDDEDDEGNGGEEEEIKEQWDKEDESKDELSEKEKGGSPLLKTKKAVIVNNVDKLVKSVDEFMEAFEEFKDYDISDLTTVFSNLIDKLNEVGLIGKSE